MTHRMKDPGPIHLTHDMNCVQQTVAPDLVHDITVVKEAWAFLRVGVQTANEVQFGCHDLFHHAFQLPCKLRAYRGCKELRVFAASPPTATAARH